MPSEYRHDKDMAFQYFLIHHLILSPQWSVTADASSLDFTDEEVEARDQRAGAPQAPDLLLSLMSYPLNLRIERQPSAGWHTPAERPNKYTLR